jgi:hypothetical protein
MEIQSRLSQLVGGGTAVEADKEGDEANARSDVLRHARRGDYTKQHACLKRTRRAAEPAIGTRWRGVAVHGRAGGRDGGDRRSKKILSGRSRRSRSKRRGRRSSKRRRKR